MLGVRRSETKSRSWSGRPPADLPSNSLRILSALRGRARSAAELERATGFSQLTVRRHVEALQRQGLVALAGFGRSNGGRQPRLFKLVSDSRLALAIHLQFPGASVATVGLDGRIVAARHVPVDGAEDPVTVLHRLADAAESLVRRVSRGRLIGLGVALPGYADLTRGIALRIGRASAWRDVPVTDSLSRRLGLAACLVHDTAAMALAESEVGDARGQQHFAFVLAEEGVSAGLFLDGTVYQGAFGNAGLLGHMTVRPAGRLCLCGSAGCVEAYASVRALVERSLELGVETAGAPPSHRDVIRFALDGREPFRTVLDEALNLLGIAIANLAKILEVRTVFVGGYPATLPEAVRQQVFDVARAHLQPPLRGNFEIRYSRVRDAGLVGAAIPVIRRFMGTPVATR